ncbi:MAG: integration host factor subunit alpha [Methylococcaceae bacterium]|jgi:integration host factor subunit alpha|nr:integration host factor subunit alpha [Methylococcaceae bacterium]
MTLTKKDMTERLLETLDINRRDAKDLVEQFFEEIKATLIQGESVKLSGFGNFELRDKSERPGRNPKTGEEIPITARRVVTFKSGQKLRAMVEAFDGQISEDP